MNRYQKLQAKFDELQKNIRAIDSKDTYQPIFLLQEASNLIRELLKELDTPRLLKSDREGIQDWDGGESRYQAYLEEFSLDGYDEREEVYYRDEFEDDEEVIDDDENCWVEYLPPTE